MTSSWTKCPEIGLHRGDLWGRVPAGDMCVQMSQLCLRNVNNDWDVGQILVRTLGSGPALWRSVWGGGQWGEEEEDRRPQRRSTSDAGGFLVLVCKAGINAVCDLETAVIYNVLQIRKLKSQKCASKPQAIKLSPHTCQNAGHRGNNGGNNS